MKKEDKELLLKDLCARLPFKIKCSAFTFEPETLLGIDIEDGTLHLESPVYDEGDGYYNIEYCKPYLRPMSSMTEEECMELSRIRPFDDKVEAWKYIKTPIPLKIANIKHFDFFHARHLDWRGLIKKGLALEAPKGMYD